VAGDEIDATAGEQTSPEGAALPERSLLHDGDTPPHEEDPPAGEPSEE
jgi:hypothetical protein